MSSRRSPPRGNSGGFAFDMVADPPTMLAPVLDEDLVGVEPGGEHAGDVHTRHVRLHRFRCMPGDTAGLIHRHADRAEQRQVRRIAGQGQDEIRGRSEEHTSELQSLAYLVCRLLLEKKKKTQSTSYNATNIRQTMLRNI